MPLTSKGKKIIKQMKAHYGAEKGSSVFYAMINEGKLKGVEMAGKKKTKKKAAKKKAAKSKAMGKY